VRYVGEREIDEGEGKRRREEWRKWFVKDQPCVRLASGDINTSGASSGITILRLPALLEWEISVQSQREV
jgi:hypothetical protein